MKDTVISACNLSVGYEKNTIVSGINFEVKQGEILTLIGPNGAGKSTVLKTIAGYLESLSGNLFIAGRDAQKISASEMSRMLSVLLTERIRPDLMSCREIVETGRYPYTGKFGLLSEHDKMIVNNAMEAAQISDLSHMDFNSVSDGQKQRVMLARAICQEPGILILDEPTSYLDIHHKIIFFETLRRLVSERKIVVILSMHELRLAEKISDNVLCIKDGKIIYSGKPAEVFTEENKREIYDIPQDLYRKYFE